MRSNYLRKVVLLGLVAAMTLGGAVGAQAHRDDDDDDDNGGDEPTEQVVESNECGSNSSTGLNLLQLCGTSIPVSLINLGENEQFAGGLLSDDDGDDDGDDGDGDGDDDGGCSNDSVGINLIQSCGLAVPVSLINLGDNDQIALAGDDDGDCSNDSVGINLIQLCHTSIPLSVLNTGENEQFAATP